MLIVRSNAFVADTRPINIQYVTCPLSANVSFACRQWTLAHPMRLAKMGHGLPSGSGHHHFFESWNMGQNHRHPFGAQVDSSLANKLFRTLP